jgi:hypothetical protein
MQSQFESEPLALRSNLITIDRPDTSQVSDDVSLLDGFIALYTCCLFSWSIYMSMLYLNMCGKTVRILQKTKQWNRQYHSALFGQFASKRADMSRMLVNLLNSVPQNMNIHDLRQPILRVCGQDHRFPRDFIYLRSVGRCLTKVRRPH